MRRRNSVSSAWGTFTRNGRIAFLSAACLLAFCAGRVWVVFDAIAVRKLRPRRAAMSRVVLDWLLVVIGPIIREFLHCRKLNALRCVSDKFAFGPLRRLDAVAQFGEF